MCSIFFFNDTATTEIYTYCHPLSLHDALPILRYPGRVLAPGELIPAQVSDFIAAHLGLTSDDLLLYAAREETRHEHLADLRRIYGRSEEHTSELQSLMRISYAVFCLKKKNKNTTTQTYKKIDCKSLRIV